MGLNKKGRVFRLAKNAVYSFGSNLVSLLIAVFVVLIVPKFIGVNDYGYWQLYIFYCSFIGFLHFGWNDGIYLKLGGDNYKELAKEEYFSQFLSLLAMQLFIFLLGYFYFINASYSEDKVYVLLMTGVSMVITNLRYMILYIMQATDRIKEYAIVTVIDRLMYLSVILLILFLNKNNYKILILGDILGKVFSFMLCIYYCKDIILQPLRSFYFNFKEIVDNIRIGSSLMFANISSKLIVGNVRFGIEYIWSIAVFGQISLILSICNFSMVFLNAISTVLFPFLRKVKEEDYRRIFIDINCILSPLLIGVLLLYFILNPLLRIWLPEYASHFKYLSVLFPIIIFEGKVTILYSTYLKVLRKERLLLVINLITLFLSLFLTFVTAWYFKNLDYVVFSILILIAFRSILSEYYLGKLLRISILKDLIIEMTLVCLFLVVAALFSNIIGFVFFLVIYISFLMINYMKFKEVYYRFRMILSV